MSGSSAEDFSRQVARRGACTEWERPIRATGVERPDGKGAGEIGVALVPRAPTQVHRIVPQGTEEPSEGRARDARPLAHALSLLAWRPDRVR